MMSEVPHPDDVFADSALAKNYAIYRPEPPSNLIETIVNYWKKGLKGTSSNSHMVDIGCGTGQSSYQFASYFQHVTGVDVSNEQIEVARQQHKDTTNLSFQVGSAEHIPVSPSSVDVITSCAAIHWFDLPTFYAQADRILRPRGVLAVYSYLDVFAYYNGTCLRPAMKEIRDGLGFHTRNHAHLEQEFKTLQALYEEEDTHIGAAEGGFEVVQQSDMEGLLGYYSTFAPLTQYRAKYGNRAAEQYMDDAKKKLFATMGTDEHNPKLELRYSYFLRMWRKPE